MKKSLILLPTFILLSSLCIFAQTSVNKPTTLAERVIGIIKVAGVDTGGFVDTFSFSYSDNRGSAFDFNYMAFDYWSYYIETFGRTYYDPSLYIKADVKVKADTVRRWTDYSPPIGILQTINTSSFAPDNKLMARSIQDQSGYEGQGIFIYNPQGLLIKTIGLAPTNGTWDTTNWNSYTYDSQGNLITDSIYSYINSQPFCQYAYNYIYNTNNQITKGVFYRLDGSVGWIAAITQDYTYYSNGKLASSISYTGDTLGLQKADSFEYNGTTDFATTQIERWYNPAFAMWIGGTKTVKHLNSNNLPDTVYEMEMNYTFTKWDTISKTAYTYTAYNNPQNAYTYGKNSNGYDSLLYSTRYYYELYNPTAVSDLPPSLEKMVLYPNPATNEINITWKNANGKRSFIEITDAAGRKCLTQSLIWNEPNQKVSIGHLTTGIYYLTVRTAGGVLIYRQTIVKD